MKILFAVLALFPAMLAAADLDSLLVPVAEMRPASARQTQAVPEAAPVSAAPLVNPRAQSVPVLQSEVLAALSDALVARYAPEGTLKIDAATPWRGATAPDSGWTLELTRLPPQGLSPRMIISFRLKAGERTLGDYTMQITCALMREVFSVTRRIERGQILSTNDVTTTVTDVLPATVNAISSSVAIGEYRTKTSIAAGDLLSWRDVELKPLVRKGQVVEAVASEGALRVTVKAVALEDGREGDIVSVRNLSTSKDIQARILDDRTVQVYF